MSPWPLTTGLVRLLWLRALFGVSEDTAAAARFTSCVAAVLGDPLKRLCMFGGRDGMPRSLGSVLGCFVTRFLGAFNGIEVCKIATPGIKSFCSGLAICRDGVTLLVTGATAPCPTAPCHGVHVFSVTSGAHLRTIGGYGDGPLQFQNPSQVYISTDDFVFIADYSNHRIQILTPRFAFHGFVGVGQLNQPVGVCADDGVVAVSEHCDHRISLFKRLDGTLIRRFGSRGHGDGQIFFPEGLCFMGSGICHNLAVADSGNDRVVVFSFDGDFVRNVGVGKLYKPTCVGCSDSGEELVIASYAFQSVSVFSASGEILKTIRGADFTSVTIHGSTIFAKGFKTECVVVLT